MDESKRALHAKKLARVGAAAFSVAAAALVLSSCASQAPPPSGDPITFGHSVWCGTNPPSGYCMYD